MNLTAILFTGALPVVFCGIVAIYRCQAHARSRRAIVPPMQATIAPSYYGRYSVRQHAARSLDVTRSSFADARRPVSGVRIR